MLCPWKAQISINESKQTHCFKQNKNKEVDIVLDLIFKSQVKTVKMGDFDGLTPILKLMSFFCENPTVESHGGDTSPTT